MKVERKELSEVQYKQYQSNLKQKLEYAVKETKTDQVIFTKKTNIEMNISSLSKLEYSILQQVDQINKEISSLENSSQKIAELQEKKQALEKQLQQIKKEQEKKEQENEKQQKEMFQPAEKVLEIKTEVIKKNV